MYMHTCTSSLCPSFFFCCILWALVVGITTIIWTVNYEWGLKGLVLFDISSYRKMWSFSYLLVCRCRHNLISAHSKGAEQCWGPWSGLPWRCQTVCLQGSSAGTPPVLAPLSGKIHRIQLVTKQRESGCGDSQLILVEPLLWSRRRKSLRHGTPPSWYKYIQKYQNRSFSLILRCKLRLVLENS